MILWSDKKQTRDNGLEILLNVTILHFHICKHSNSGKSKACRTEELVSEGSAVEHTESTKGFLLYKSIYCPCLQFADQRKLDWTMLVHVADLEVPSSQQDPFPCAHTSLKKFSIWKLSPLSLLRRISTCHKSVSCNPYSRRYMELSVPWDPSIELPVEVTWDPSLRILTKIFYRIKNLALTN